MIVDRVTFRREARNQLEDLYFYIAGEGSPAIATRYTDAPLTYCDGLRMFPMRGSAHDKIYPGLRLINWRRRTTIAFLVSTTEVTIVGVYHGGQDFIAFLQISLRG